MKPNNSYMEALDEQLAALFDIREPFQAQVQAQAAEVPACARKAFARSSWIAAERLLSGLLIMGILSCLGAFFLFVPLLPVVTVAFMLSGLLAMFWMGLYLGSRRAKS